MKAPAERSSPASADFARLDTAGVLVRLSSSPDGLTDAEAAARLPQYGENVIAGRARRSPLLQLAAMFATPLPLMLIVLAIVADLTGEEGGAVVIAIMVVLSTLLSFVQEHRADRAAERLRAMVHTTATVRRRATDPDGPSQEREIPLHALVPGDVVHLRAGDMVPADLRLLASKDLFVNQAALTGESLPAEKHATPPHDPVDSPLLEPTLCFLGSNVVSGTATGVVAATGRGTYFASIAEGLDRAPPPTAFDQGVSRFIGLLLRFMVVMVPLVFFVNGLTKGHWTEAFLFAVAVAVGLTPEMLPMLVTINLGKGALAMSRKQVIVKRLAAIQNFGAMDILCTDKTGTLTQDRVLLKRHIDIFGHESARVLDYAYLNSHYQSGLKNLLDVAILEHGDVHAALGIDTRYAKVDEIPFDFERRRMSVVVSRDSHAHLLISKGAVEEIFGVCTHAERGDETVDLAAGHLEDLQAVVRELNEDGFRVIAVATRTMPARDTPYTVADESGLTLAGYIAFLDPPKETAAEALRRLHRHGVAVKVLTGDNEVITRKVCREVGLPTEHCLLGRDIEAMDDARLAKAARTATVFAKLAPLQKARIIEALRRSGHVVGFLGDGINDSPALKAADVGVSVDTAVDIAKESADIVLLEKSLLVLDEGVIEGRKVFGNIVKYLKMGASSNFGNMLSVLGASAFLPFLPMAPVQILLNNLLYDISQTAVATDRVDREYTRAPRRWDIGHIARFMLLVGPISSVFDYVTYAVLLYGFGAWTDPMLFQTGWFVESLLSQTLVVHVIRTGKVPLLQSRASLPLAVTTVAICLLGAWLPYSPFAPLLGFKPLPLSWWVVLAGILTAYLLVTQTVKAWLVRRFGLG